MNLSAPLSETAGIPTRFLPKLKRLGIETVRELLFHFPARYEDFSQTYQIADLIPGQEATIQGVVKDVSGRRTWRRHLFIVEAVISDDSGSIRAVWFNQPYIRNILKPGRLANLAGKVTENEKGELYLSNPTYELLSTHYAEHSPIHTGRIVPVYPETRGLTSKGIRFLIRPLLDEDMDIKEPLPPEILTHEGFPGVNVALHNIHFPEDMTDALAAKKRFAFEDLFFLQLRNIRERLRLMKERATAIATDVPRMKQLIEKLPFPLTLSQKTALWEILQDLAKPHPMNRLLQGDVGSGKTVVAALSALEAAHGGLQTAFMAPTELLARQHYHTFLKLFGEFEGGVGLLTANEARAFYGHGMETEMKKTELQQAIANGRIAIAIGTHALIEKAVTFPHLALVVVDEQHRFGVKQRAALTHARTLMPHFLSMSATPIPRTLSLTVFGDLDLSLITELPKDRKPIITKTVTPEHRAKAYEFIRDQVRGGRQVFVICPRIERPETGDVVAPAALRAMEMKNVAEEYEKLSKKVFPDLRVEMLHGRIPAKGEKLTKEKIMKDFVAGKIDILVATSVVEVGVDVPNASLMMIENAERFGLAQLYQFRGRVGRGAHQSYCFLFSETDGGMAKQRLQSIVEAKNGFELAEKDLKLRGPGEFLGETQSGMPDLAMKAIQNPELVKRAREAAVKIIEHDPALKEYPALRERLAVFESQVHWE